MFYLFLTDLIDIWGGFNLFRYISFRTGGAVITALLFCFFFGPAIINSLRVRQSGHSNIREDVPDNHLQKSGTPSMGGVMILGAMIFSLLLWADLKNPYVWIVILVMIGFGLIGFVDDYQKLARKNQKGMSAGGLSGRLKLFIEAIIALFAAILYQNFAPQGLGTDLVFPLIKDISIDLGWFFFLFAIFVITGSANAVNLTDGLDGLAIMPVMIAAGCFGLIAYFVGNAVYSDYLNLFRVQGSGELAVIGGAMIGAGMGFLWFNAPPAQVFMGDTGSLSLGGGLGAMAMITKHEIVLAIIGGLFVLEAVSVIVQVASFRLTGKRIFQMAPLHHHFEKKGWSEPTIVIRFWIIASILAMIGLATLKLR